ncbi:Uncharacterized protein SCF082_LOCUS30683 [Durusdinium trenchii]|uniref:Uncharacterized protein n=1 Tax=Durusdinium trenchii TaxID=1381693 RepID=A0ABP0MZW0_9DINO
MQKRSRKNRVHVEKGWYTKEKMKTELKWSKERIKAAVAYCTDMRRVKTHVRRDKYERNIKEYWVDVQTTGSFEDENEEALIDRTFGEGEASTFDLGLPASDLHSPGGEPAGDESDREVEEDFDDGVSARIPGKAEVQKESTLEDGAIDNVGSVMQNLLRVQTRMEVVRSKLEEIATAEAKETPSTCST